MPNWTYTTIKVSEADFPKLKELLDVKAVKSEYGIAEWNVDFNKLLPIHSDLDIQSGSGSYIDAKTYPFTGLCKEQIEFQKDTADKIMEEIYNSDISKDDFIAVAVAKLHENPKVSETLNKMFYTIDNMKTFVQGYFNLHRHGFVDWYEARNNLWGTKWNASDVYLSDENHSIMFRTAWATPIGIIKELAKHMSLTIAFADENMGGASGIFEFTKGNTNNPKDMLSDIIKKHYYDNEAKNTILTYLVNTYLFGGDIENFLCSWDEDDMLEIFSPLSMEEIENTANEIDEKVFPLIEKYL